MSGLGYACALLLAAVFVRAGGAKLARPAATAAGFAALGVPAAPVVARAVPFVELLTAVVLIGAPRAGGVAAVVLLVGFSGVLVPALRSGAAAPCNCFGTARTDPVSGVDLMRNALLGVLALASTAAPTPRYPGLSAILAVAAAFAGGRAVTGALRRRR